MVWSLSLFFWACGTTECMESHRTEIDAAVLETGTEKFSGIQKRLRKMQERMNEHVEETILCGQRILRKWLDLRKEYHHERSCFL